MYKKIVIDSAEAILSLCEYINDFGYVAYDTETTGINKDAEIIGISFCAEESVAFYIIIAYWDKEQSKLVYINNMKEEILPLISKLATKKTIMHNAMFDCEKTQSNYSIDLTESLHTDTMVLAHLLDENRRIALKELATIELKEDVTEEQRIMKQSIEDNGGSITKANYELYKADPYLIGEYGAKDALVTFRLFMKLVPQLYAQNLQDFFYDDESMPLLKGPTYQLNTTGLKVDVNKLNSLKKTLEAECLEAKDYIYQEIHKFIKDKYPGTNKKNTFNIGSSSQLAWLIFGQMELEFSSLTKAGKTACRSMNMRLPYTFGAKRSFIDTCISQAGMQLSLDAVVNGKKVKGKKIRLPWYYIACDKKTLQKLAPRFKWIEKLLEYQRKTKLLTTYIKGIEARIRYGIIHPSFLQTGTTSGRYSSRNPNFQNLPRDDKRIKECIIARPGKVFVGADYSQLEPRVFAFYSKDIRLQEAFRSENDFYSVIGMGVYNKTDCTPHKEGSDNAFGVKYKKLRDLSKVIALASTYGATAHQLAPTTGKSIEDTQQDIDNYFEEFPGVKSMMIEAHNLAKSQGYVENLFGRKRRIPEAMRIEKLYGDTDDLPYEARNLLNLAVNHRIQSTGASIVNRAAIKMHNNLNKLGIKAALVLQVHDSFTYECEAKDADTVALLLQDAMENTVTLEGVLLEAVPKIGNNLAEV